MSFIKRKIEATKQWWMAPTTHSDRLTGGLVGGIAGLWIGGLGSIIFGQLPVSFEVVVAWALCAACLGFALGIRFPKIMTVILFPFATFGCSFTS